MNLPMIYTAQSKQFFYCRDAVCEFVFKNGAIPINPFRVFDYFLSDRVSRDSVRMANFELLKRCDEVWAFGRSLADGVLVEIAQAEALSMPVRFFDIRTSASEIMEIGPQCLSFEAEAVRSSGLQEGQLLELLHGGSPELVAAALGRSDEVRHSA